MSCCNGYVSGLSPNLDPAFGVGGGSHTLTLSLDLLTRASSDGGLLKRDVKGEPLRGFELDFLPVASGPDDEGHRRILNLR